MYKSDSDIQQAVMHELAWDTRVVETDVGVQVDRGVVTLTGTVSSWPQRIAAQEAAHRVAGVLDVANDVRVKLPGSAERSDTDLAHAVRHALEWDVLVPDKQIRSTVTDGWVSLEGEVEYWSQREDAEEAVHNLAGVKGVTNKIAVEPTAVPDDVRKSIEDALSRRAAAEARSIHLNVAGGEVTLSGVVHSWAERQAVVAAASSTPGVRRVEDKLQLEPNAA